MIYSLLLALGGYLSVVNAWEQIKLNYDATSANMVVMFASTDSTDVTAYVRYGTDASNLDHVATAVGSTYSLRGYTSPMLYKATLVDLEDGNHVYYYSVGSDVAGYTEVMSFKSHPGVSVDDVTFFVIGDLGQTSNSETTIAELMETESTLTSLSGGIVNVGDLSYANGIESLWDSFANMLQPAVSALPMMTTLGNHEWLDDAAHSFAAYTARFDNPPVGGTRELYYSFNAGLVHWVMVAGYCEDMKSTVTQPCLAKGSPQMDWLTNDLAKVDRSETPWVIVSFHEPYVNSNTAHSMSKEGYPMQSAIEDTLYEYKVDIVFSGHVHAYERSCSLYQYVCQDGAPYYITIGDGGNKEGLATGWVEPQPDWSLFRQASYGFGKLRVVNSTHAQWSWHQNSDLIPTIADEYFFVKGGDSSSLTSGAARGAHRVTGEPMFVSGPRGDKARYFNHESQLASSRVVDIH